MTRIEPPWVGELVGQWAGQDWVGTRHELGFPNVSPMFSKVVSAYIEDDVAGYSHGELRAMIAAVDWLHLTHYEHWRALSREFRHWSRKTLPEKPGDQDLVMQAGRLLEKYIDDVLG